MKQSIQTSSLLEEEENILVSRNKPLNKNKKLSKFLIFFVIVSILALVAMFLIQNLSNDDSSIMPIKVQIPWFQNKSIIMQMGTSRVLQPLLYSGHDDRTKDDFKSVTERQIKWNVQPSGIVTIDLYGRMNAVKIGICKLTLSSLANPNAQDSRTVQVVDQRKDNDVVPKRVIKFSGQPSQVVRNLQKLVQRFTKQQIIDSAEAPQTVKDAVQDTQKQYPKILKDKDIIWSIDDFADKTPRRYVKRQNTAADIKNRDKFQYFIGDRYIPDEGTSPIMIETDNNFGLWIVSKTGNTNHIKMVDMRYSQKSDMMIAQTQKYVLRHGMASDANFNGQKWVPAISDNDGLWTSMYAAGQLMKYSVLKQNGADQTKITKAREGALKSLKAVLMIANVAGRQGKVNAKIRHLINTRVGQGAIYSHEYLKQGKQNCRDTYAGKPTDGIGFYGVDAGKTIKGDYFSGQFKYSMLPLKPQDWSKTGSAAFTQKNLDGFVSRSFAINGLDQPISPDDGGLFFRRHQNLTHSVISGASTLYDYTKADHPNLQLGNKPIPKALQSFLNINGVQYNVSDLIYKGDTSTDQIIGHLFIYKIAYDILDQNDQEEKGLKDLIRDTMRNFAQHLINNGYMMVDATGQATKWTKLYKQFYTTDYTIEDGPLKAIQFMLSLKLAYYVTGQRKFKEEYDLVAKDEKFYLIDFVGMLWDRYVYAFTKSDDSGSGLYKLDYSLNPTFTEIQRHSIYSIHFSDEQQAYLAYYLAFQLQEDAAMRQKYKKGIQSYWHSISRSQNPLWYYIYQLAYPEKPMKDAFGNDLRQVAAWQLSRHMIDTTKYQAFIEGARSDVIKQGDITVDPTKIVGKRTSKMDEKYVSNPKNFEVFPDFNPNNIYQIKVVPADQRSIHKFNGGTFQNVDGDHGVNSMQPSTTFTLPYWLGVYHGMIKYN